MSAEVRVVCRPFDAKTDSGFVYSSWRNSAFYGASPPLREDAATFFHKQTEWIAHTLWDAKVHIACLEDSPNTIVGYSVVTGDHLDWVYVKPDYREKGIATMLIPPKVTSYTSFTTKIGRAILKKRQVKEN
jgi:GNAT superfamily N-acetyltransferase